MSRSSLGATEPAIEKIDFSYEQTSDFLLPQPAALKSFGWEHLHFEHHHQPQFDTPEHEELACDLLPRIAVS